MKEYCPGEARPDVRFYVPTHSLLNYAQWRIVSPESSLLDLPGIDGYIAQVWTGTAAPPTLTPAAWPSERWRRPIWNTASCRSWSAARGAACGSCTIPIEDNPRHDWNDYRANYIRTLIASLLHPDVWHYEVSPWPSRVFHGRFPQGSRDARTIGRRLCHDLAVVFNQLRDMKQEDVDHGDATEGIGVFLSDSAMFQRADPAFSVGVARGPRRCHSRRRLPKFALLTGFYGLTLAAAEARDPRAAGPTGQRGARTRLSGSSIACWC